MGGLEEARTRWALTGRRNRPGTACAARAELNGYCLRFRAPPRATIRRRAPLQRCAAASDGGDLSSPTHRSSTPKGGMDARAMGCCHAPACVRVRTQPPCLFCACAIGRPALSRPRGDRCRQTCFHAIVAAVRSFGTSPARCRRHQVRSPTRVALRPTLALPAPSRPGIACALAPSRRFASARPPVWPPPCAKRGVAARSRRCCGLSPRTRQLPDVGPLSEL